MPSGNMYQISPKQVVSRQGWSRSDGAAPAGPRVNTGQRRGYCVPTRSSRQAATAPSTSPSHPWCSTLTF